jgi:uncharacterized protein (DUF1501 family)
MKNNNTRRDFFRTALAGGALANIGAMNAFAQSATDYKALVCVYLFGGNDGNNVIVPQTQANYNAYKAIRLGLALPDTSAKLLPVTDAATGLPYALSDGLVGVHPLWAQNKLAVVANVGMLVKPTTRAQYLANSVPLPTNLFSHSDQTSQMQSGVPSTGGGTGWAGRIADQAAPMNGAASFPAGFSISGPALFTTGSVVQSASLYPGFDLDLYGMNVWPASATAARKTALQQLLTFDSGMALVQAANKVRQDASALNAMLKDTSGTPPLPTVFPGTQIGQQMQQVANIIRLRNATGMKRQVFFCALGGFDTHGSQGWQHWNLLSQLSAAMGAFYQATVDMGIADKVTAFTLSEFGRSLQPSGSGSDHGWGNHHMVMGGAVQGGRIYGQFPVMALGGPDDSGNRGVWIPGVSTDQFGATLGSWFGLSPAQNAAVFPNLVNFSQQNLGFV